MDGEYEIKLKMELLEMTIRCYEVKGIVFGFWICVYCFHTDSVHAKYEAKASSMVSLALHKDLKWGNSKCGTVHGNNSEVYFTQKLLCL